MRKVTSFKECDGTSFHHQTIKATPRDLINLAERLGSIYTVENTGRDKVNFDFIFKTEDGATFTVYDWKYYRKINEDELITFNIGTLNESDSIIAKQELLNELKKK